ncbi:MAG: 5-formyltetrahydrofolate cyclo-ligase [Sporichthyaceae bacterium]|nr:5-formyltetrahydrofolate cyclo-ligase [Sporichthyaceae bacterium]
MLSCVTAAGLSSKAALRAEVLAARRSLSGRARDAAATALARALLDLPELVSADCVAAYLSFGTEPATTSVLPVLRSRGVRVLLPVLRPDRDLDWTVYVESDVMPQDRAAWAPGQSLGVQAVSDAGVVVVPALAVGTDGTRLGRGGGSYDRALARLPRGRSVVALLYDGELLPRVPSEPHDRRVTAALTPTAVHRFSAAPGRP